MVDEKRFQASPWSIASRFAATGVPSYCKVLEVEPNKTLSCTWEAMGLESIVTWTLSPTSTGTHLRMEQVGFRPDQEQAYQGAKFG